MYENESVNTNETKDENILKTEELSDQMFLKLSEGNFDDADEVCDMLIEAEPQNHIAYFGKLMAELKVKNHNELFNYPRSFANNENYKKILECGSEKTKETLKDCLQAIDEKSRQKKRKTTIAGIAISVAALLIIALFLIIPSYQYNQAKKLCAEGMYEESYEIYKKLGKFKDADAEAAKFMMVPVSMTEKDNNGNTETYKYEYDSAGKLTKVTHSFDEDKTSVQYYYDDKGNIIKKVDEYDTYMYTYDEEGNCIKETSNSGDVLSEYTYDENGRCIKEISTNLLVEPGYSVQNVYEYTYDEKGNLIKFKNGHYRRSSESVYTYDNMGNCIKEIYSDDRGYKQTQEWTYDDKGNCIKIVYIDNTENNYVENYEYDHAGNRIKTYSDDGVTVYEYIYDENNNCIKCIIKSDDAYSGVRIKEYTYDNYGRLTKENLFTDDGEREEIKYVYDYKIVYIDMGNKVTNDKNEEIFADKGKAVNEENNALMGLYKVEIQMINRVAEFEDEVQTDKLSEAMRLINNLNDPRYRIYDAQGNLIYPPNPDDY